MPGANVKRTRGSASEASAFTVMKGSVGTINKGEVVYVSGYDAGESLLLVERALANSSTTMPSIGFADESISDTVEGTVIIKGIISGIDTSSFNLRDELYVSESVAGGFTTTIPSDETLSEKIGCVIRSHATEGCVEIYGGGLVLLPFTIEGLVEETAPDGAADYVPIHDASSGTKKKVLLDNLLAAESGSYSATILSWTAFEGLYYADVTHSLGTKDISVHAYALSDNRTVGLADIERTDNNTVRVWVALQESIRVIVLSAGSVAYDLTRRLLYADQLLSPNNADWAVNALAPADLDPSNNALVVRLFDDTTEEGVGWMIEIPSGSTNMKMQLKSRAITAPGAARTVGVKLYARGVPDNAAVEAWDAGTQWTDLDIPVNAYYQYDSETKTLASLGLTAGRTYQFELTRVNPIGGTDLVGDWALLEVGLEFS